MNRIVNRIVIGTVMAVSLGLASQSFASDKVECSYSANGKTTQKMLSNKAECHKLGGKIVAPKAAASTTSNSAPAKPTAR